MFLFTTAPRPARAANPTSYAMGTRGSFPGVKRPGLETNHSPPSSAEAKECVELYVHSPNSPSLRGAPLKHRDNFTYFNLSSTSRSRSDFSRQVYQPKYRSMHFHLFHACYCTIHLILLDLVGLIIFHEEYKL